jgi:TnpA family transposase
MWNVTAELAQIRRQELLAEAREERLARIARHEDRSDRARRDGVAATAVSDERRAVTEAPLR